jgi:biopolymer transport protein ExbD
MAGSSIFGGHKSIFGKEGEIGLVDLNLTPLMDVMSNILFFLMASVGASVVALLPAALPTRSESAAGAEPPANQVMVTLQISAAGFKAHAQNERLSREELAALRFELPAAGAGGWAKMPYEELTTKLLSIKEKYRASDTVIILPEDKVPYDVIVRTMDAARGTGSAPRTNLFTKVVISDLVK